MDADSSSTYKQELRILLPYLFHFVRRPVEGIKQSPRLSWPSLLSVQIGGAMLSGCLVGLINRNFWDFLIGLLIFPLTGLVSSLVFTLFLAYFFSLFRSTYLDFRQLYGIVVLANLPYFIFHTVSGFLPPIDLIAFALTAILLIVGMVEQFGLERRTVVRLVGILYFVFVVLWITAQLRSADRSSDLSHITQPQSLDELERDIHN